MKPLAILCHSALFPNTDDAWKNEIPAHLKRRDPRIWQMAYVCAARLLKNSLVKPRSIIVGTALGALDETKGFLDGVFTDGFGSPKNFIASVHNSMAGKLALEFSIDGPNLTLCDGQNSFASAIGNCDLLGQECFPALVVAVDENIPLLDAIVPALSSQCNRFLSGHKQEGAVSMLLDCSQNTPRIRSVGPRYAGPMKDKACTPAAIQALFGSSQPPARFYGLSECNSFLFAAIRTFTELQKKQSGSTIIPSYSPSSNAFAAIELSL